MNDLRVAYVDLGKHESFVKRWFKSNFARGMREWDLSFALVVLIVIIPITVYIALKHMDNAIKRIQKIHAKMTEGKKL